MPIDTTKWTLTETIVVDLNLDGIFDNILIFDKYNALTRPNNVQTPVLFFLGKKTNSYTFLGSGDKIIYSPFYEFKIVNNNLIINQKGIGNDEYTYTNYYHFQNGEIYMVKELVEQKIEKLIVNDETGDVSTITERIDTIYIQDQKTPVMQYDFFEFMNKFQN